MTMSGLAAIALLATGVSVCSGAPSERSGLVLEAVVYVSRHGIRSPYPPTGAVSASDWRPYTTQPPPDAAAWGDTEAAFLNQELTPHGAAVVRTLGGYLREKWANASLIGAVAGSNCDLLVACVAPRDHACRAVVVREA